MDSFFSRHLILFWNKIKRLYKNRILFIILVKYRLFILAIVSFSSRFIFLQGSFGKTCFMSNNYSYHNTNEIQENLSIKRRCFTEII